MFKVSYKEISKKEFNSQTKGVYFLYGKDKCIVRECEQKLIVNLFGKDEKNFDLIKMDGENINLDKLMVSLEMYPIRGSKKCLLIRDVNIEDMNVSDMKKLTQIIESVPEFVIIIFCQRTHEVDDKKSGKWIKFLNVVSNIGYVVDCTVSTSKEIENRIVKFTGDRNKSINRENINLIIDRCGKKLDVIYSELEKLCNFEDKEEISKESIDKIVYTNLEYNVFEICKYILSKKRKEVHDCLDKLFLFREEPILILSIIYSTYVDMYRFKICSKYGVAEKMMSEFFDYKGKEYKIKSARYNSNSISLNAVKKSIELLIRADREIKTKNIDGRIIIDMVVIELINLVNKNV